MKRYSPTLMTLHWLTALAVVIAYVTSGNPAKARDAVDAVMDQLHVLTGIAVWALVALRLPLRLLRDVPPALPAPRWQTRAAQTTHYVLYGLMFLVPLAGWAALSDKTAAFRLVGAFNLPLLDAHAGWVKTVGETHQTLGNIFIWLAGLHAAVALGHHFVRRDATLLRMLPRGLAKSKT